MEKVRKASSDGSADDKAHINIFPETVLVDESLYRRTAGKTFEDSDSLETFYKPIESYEGRHRYDPDFRWEPEEEKAVVRKVGSAAP